MLVQTLFYFRSMVNSQYYARYGGDFKMVAFLWSQYDTKKYLFEYKYACERYDGDVGTQLPLGA